MDWVNIKTPAVLSPSVNFQNGHRKKKHTVAHRSPRSWTVWPAPMQIFNINLWPKQVVILGSLQRREWSSYQRLLENGERNGTEDLRQKWNLFLRKKIIY